MKNIIKVLIKNKKYKEEKRPCLGNKDEYSKHNTICSACLDKKECENKIKK